MNGRFIVLEGVEGVGKSTQITRLGGWLEATGKTVLSTREPGGTTLGERIRTLLLSRGPGAIGSDAELLLMFAARAQHLEEVIRPGLGRGCWVLCDRFTDATYAYQGAGRGIDRSKIIALENWAQGNFRPDLVIVLDLAVAEALERLRGRGPADRFETESFDFFHRVRQCYLERAAANPEKYAVVDAHGSEEDVESRVRACIEAATELSRD